MSVIREIHTTFFSDAAAEIIAAAFKKTVCYSHSSSNRRTAKTAEVLKNPNGEICVIWDSMHISHWYLCKNIRKNDDIAARQWIAWQIKDVVYAELEREHCDHEHRLWSRKNTNASKYLTEAANRTVTIQEAYCLYDMLQSRKNVDKRYPAEMIEGFNGTENDPFKTEMEIQRRNEVKRISEEYQTKINDADIGRYQSALFKEMDEQLSNIRKQYRLLSEQRINEFTAERDAKIKELNDQFAAMAAI